MMRSITEDIQRAIEAAERDAARAGFAARLAAIEHLEIHVLDRLAYLEEAAPALRALEARALALQECLESANERFVARLRDRLRAGRYTPEGLKRAFARYAGPLGDRSEYDALDWLVAGLLDDGAELEADAAREPEMVAYQPTPARVVLRLIEAARLGPGEVFYDLGSGLGLVVMLVALLSGARAVGVEFDPALSAQAERSARRLNLPGVSFACADAREASLAEGSIYFLYTPFRGALLAQVLERLRAIATARPIRVCTYGPCTPEVAASAPWLNLADGELSEHALAVFDSAVT